MLNSQKKITIGDNWAREKRPDMRDNNNLAHVGERTNKKGKAEVETEVFESEDQNMKSRESQYQVKMT